MLAFLQTWRLSVGGYRSVDTFFLMLQLINVTQTLLSEIKQEFKKKRKNKAAQEHRSPKTFRVRSPIEAG